MRASPISRAAGAWSCASTTAGRSAPRASSTSRTSPPTSSGSSRRDRRRSRSKRSCPAERPAYNPPLFGSRMRFFLALFVAASCAVQAAAPQPPAIIGRSWVLGDLSSGQVLAAQRADERFGPASLTKMMTAYVVFAALRDRKLALDQQLKVSERAWKAPGARMYLEPRRPVAVEELIRGMVVQSANDACVALAEALAGSEEAFAQMMNREAERLGMKNTRFVNASGLPHAQHYSTAQDLYNLAAALIRDFPHEYAQYYSQKEFR